MLFDEPIVIERINKKTSHKHREESTEKTMRQLTKEERQILLDHPELVMFDTKWEPDIKKVAIFTIPGIMSVLIPAALSFSPLGRSQNGLVTVLSIALLIIFCAAFVWLYLYFDNSRYEKAQKSYNISFLRKTLPDELVLYVKKLLRKKDL